MSAFEGLQRSPTFQRTVTKISILCPREESDLIFKASKDNDSLTDSERRALLALPDLEKPVYGEAKPSPKTLTAGERVEVRCGMPTWPK